MTVRPEWIDFNGHLNMAYYNVLFDEGADEVYPLMGFGPERVMFGSNFPVDSLHQTYPDLLDFVMREVGDDPQALTAVMGGTARSFYQF